MDDEKTILTSQQPNLALHAKSSVKGAIAARQIDEPLPGDLEYAKGVPEALAIHTKGKQKAKVQGAGHITLNNLIVVINIAIERCSVTLRSNSVPAVLSLVSTFVLGGSFLLTIGQRIEAQGGTNNLSASEIPTDILIFAYCHLKLLKSIFGGMRRALLKGQGHSAVESFDRSTAAGPFCLSTIYFMSVLGFMLLQKYAIVRCSFQALSLGCIVVSSLLLVLASLNLFSRFVSR